MRRPLKPFITEYKTSARRQASSPTAEAAPARSPEPWPKPDADDAYETAMRAADALFSRGTTAAAPLAPLAPSPVEDSAAKPAGRILRVIDEPPSVDFSALEAAHAPKRRGRKPGSKNKPKVPALVSALAPAADEAPRVAGLVPTVAPRAATTPAARTLPALSGTAAAPAASRTATKRFGWVRDRLGPGEDWKRRRLPRICW